MGSFDVYDKQDNVEEKPDNSSDKQNNTDVRQDALMHIINNIDIGRECL